MFKIQSFGAHPSGWRMVMAFNLPFGNITREIEEIHTEKIDAMRSFSSNANTMLDVRIEEFSMMVHDRVLPHFIYKKRYPFYNYDETWLKFYWDWKFFIESIAEKRIHSYSYSKSVLNNINHFKNVIPKYEGLKYQRQVLEQIIPEIESIAKNVMDITDKLHVEFLKQIENDNGI